jgi:hypothetical protein
MAPGVFFVPRMRLSATSGSRKAHVHCPGPLREGLMRVRRGPGSVGPSGPITEERFKVSEQERGRMAAERARAHLARANLLSLGR